MEAPRYKSDRMDRCCTSVLTDYWSRLNLSSLEYRQKEIERTLQNYDNDLRRELKEIKKYIYERRIKNILNNFLSRFSFKFRHNKTTRLTSEKIVNSRRESY